MIYIIQIQNQSLVYSTYLSSIYKSSIKDIKDIYLSLLYYNILSNNYVYQPLDTFNFTPLTIEIIKIVKQEKHYFYIQHYYQHFYIFI